ncbi:unnamed protein product [Spirodela intermedia]|uniref:Uncharacterized protein n=1 Tax=Spirodela intermedia TaxID=51605 RepID=A0A7I8L8T5_SPIIN|nr:unnamed protein product [Spirodela intermedia]
MIKEKKSTQCLPINLSHLFQCCSQHKTIQLYRDINS